MDLQTEAHFLHIWYTLMQIVFAITPPIYFLVCHNSIRLCRYCIILPFLTSFAALCLVNEAYYLARPVYVCFYPVRGETYRHPEESRLKIQWILNFLAAAFAAAAGFSNFAETIILGNSKTGVAGSGERREEKKNDLGWAAEGPTGREETRKERLHSWTRRDRVLMASAWAVGICGYCAMAGRSKKGKFGFY